MNKKIGNQTYELENKPVVLAGASFVGNKEMNGPFKRYFKHACVEDKMGEKTFEKAERKFFEKALQLSLDRAGLRPKNIDIMVGGDILNQIVSANYTAREFQIPFLGVYGACSTMSESLIIGASLLSSGVGSKIACLTGSHFSSAERQYRNPLEFGNQRQTYSQWTATGAGSVILSSEGEGIKVSKFTVGKVTDYGVLDIANMSAAMAPAAFETLKAFFADTNTSPDDYDLIATGDLGKLGADILRDLAVKAGFKLGANYMDCGHSLFTADQKTFQGASGAGCSAIVLTSYIFDKLKNKEINNALLIATGALMSTTTNQQGDSIPCIAHLVMFEN